MTILLDRCLIQRGKREKKKEMFEESIEIENKENIMVKDKEVERFGINKQNNIKMLQENMLCYIGGYVVNKLGNINHKKRYSRAENVLR